MDCAKEIRPASRTGLGLYPNEVLRHAHRKCVRKPASPDRLARCLMEGSPLEKNPTLPVDIFDSWSNMSLLGTINGRQAKS